ncbi:putative ATP-dependent helicase DinG [BD1-7 clade bacterium]|uniref:ATP-dependent DNA helicase DinG n=1 Tax=BD1-7 clade bacterium TaxID=2029982 RepID=A0A5S9QAJ4_9GAMM|nr:putative ATP-dependent helicase DinG [BD1-7 clade bacterium]CAA0115166.1 putative ATP-dependent helicase DinG [BD1-7 clade bacterium]
MLTQAQKQSIQQAYSAFLKNRSLKPRQGQKMMIGQIARTLGAIERDGDGNRINDAGVCAIEAGTGTGKTVAYTLAVLPLAKALGKKVVISTATIALQEQILQRDLPDIQKYSDLNIRFALAKGRGRYLCLSKLDLNLNANMDQDNLFGFEQSAQSDDEERVQVFETMAKALLTGDWDGDRDNWQGEIDDDDWRALTADRNQCTGRRCQHVAQCAFIKARETLSTVDCVVANHDLVMADLALGGGAILPAPEDTIYVFDEAHHLPDIALRHFAGQTRVIGGMHWFDQCMKSIQEIGSENGGFIKLLNRLDLVPGMLLELKQLYGQLKPIVEELVAPLMAEVGDSMHLPYYRFEGGMIPGHLHQLAEVLRKRFSELVDELMAAHDVLSQSLDDNDTGLALPVVETLYADVGQMLGAAEKQLALWQAYSEELEDIPESRWIQLIESGGLIDYELCTSPLLAARTLRYYLWSRCYGAVLTSATLTALGEFHRLAMHAGIPKYTETSIVPSPFDYAANARFYVPGLKSDPGNHDAHSEEIARFIPQLSEGYQGVLVLFSSRRQLQDVYDLLDATWQSKTLCQSHMSKQKLLEEHRTAIDNGHQSILFGLASLAEGVDLPGEYCSHVIIAKIPFSVPSDPVDAALAEWLEGQGRNAFMEISLPEASQRLVQACGRLIRTEKDGGQVTLLDKRIVTKRYGRQILNALPPFHRMIEPNH